MAPISTKPANSFKTLQRGTALIRAKIASQASAGAAASALYTYSQPVMVNVRQGMEINGKDYDFTSEVFPGSNAKKL